MKTLQTFICTIGISFVLQVLTGCDRAQDPCKERSHDYYFGVEITGMLCGYSIARECSGLKDGVKTDFESNEVLIKLSVLGEGVDNRISSLFGMDPVSRRLMFNEIKINTGNTSIVSSTRIKGDTAWFTGDNTPGPKKIFLPPDVILEYPTSNDQTSHTGTVPLQYQPYPGKYTDLDRNRIFKILYQDKGLAIDIPGQMIMPLDEPDSAGQWYPKITRQIGNSLTQNPSG